MKRWISGVSVILWMGTATGYSSSEQSSENYNVVAGGKSTAQTRTNSQGYHGAEPPNVTTANKPFTTTDLGFLGKPIGQMDYYDGTLVWVGDKNGPLHTPDAVFVMDIATKAKKMIGTTHYQDDAAVITPQVSKHWITWQTQGRQALIASLHVQRSVHLRRLWHR
jgi:hypothetical protein